MRLLSWLLLGTFSLKQWMKLKALGRGSDSTQMADRVLASTVTLLKKKSLNTHSAGAWDTRN